MPRAFNLGRRNRRGGTVETVVDFSAGTKLFDVGRPCRRVYLLRSGKMQVSSGRDTILEHLRAGDFFGEEAFLVPRERRQAAKSLTPITVAVFRVSQLLDRIQQDRRFALRFLKNLAVRFDMRGQTIRDFVTEPAERRLARVFFRFAPGTASGWVRLRFSPTNAELARTIGTTRGRISQFIGRFRQLGWLQRRPELWVNREGLRKFLEE